MAEVLEKLRVRYQCSVCHRSWSRKEVTERHVAEGCVKDPEARGCGTCKHDVRAEAGGWDDPGSPGYCQIEIRPAAVTFIVGCSKWEAR